MILYLDTSSLIKLFVHEAGSDDVEARAADASVLATSVIAYPETHAALGRRHREGALSRSELRRVLERFRTNWIRFLAVVLAPPVYTRAGSLALKHALRGMDAIHLSSFLELIDLGDEVEFLSHDARLIEAARRARRARPRLP